MLLDSKIDFEDHLRNISNKMNKILYQDLQNIIPRSPLLTIYKFLIRPHLNFGYIIYDQTFNNSFKLEMI